MQIKDNRDYFLCIDLPELRFDEKLPGSIDFLSRVASLPGVAIGVGEIGFSDTNTESLIMERKFLINNISPIRPIVRGVRFNNNVVVSLEMRDGYSIVPSESVPDSNNLLLDGYISLDDTRSWFITDALCLAMYNPKILTAALRLYASDRFSGIYDASVMLPGARLKVLREMQRLQEDNNQDDYDDALANLEDIELCIKELELPKVSHKLGCVITAIDSLYHGGYIGDPETLRSSIR